MLKIALKIVSLTLLVLALATPSLAQNTKGDRPATSRENRFKTPIKKGEKKEKPGKRIRAKRKTDASQRAYVPRKRSRGGERAGRPIRPTYHDRTPSNKQKAWKGDLTGRRIRAPRQPASSAKNTFPQTGRYMRRSPDYGGDRSSRTNTVTQARIRRLQSSGSGKQRSPGRQTVSRPRSVSGRIQKFYPQSGRFVNNPSKTPRSVQRPVSNRPQLARLKKLQGPDPRPKKVRKVVPRSASGSYIARRSTNTWAHFPRPKKRGERAYLKDIAGRPLRTKNYETPRREVILPTFKPYYGRKRIGDRPYKGPASGGHVTATRGGRAWRGDLAGRRVRGRNFTSKKSVEGQPILPLRIFKPRHRDKPYVYRHGGYKSATRPGEKRTGKMPLAVRTPGIGADGVDYSGRIKGRRPLKGGGSVSGRLWNNKGRAIAGRTPGIGADRIGKYQGNIKPRMLDKRAASKLAGYPGKLRRFQARPGFADQGEEFTGNVKARRPLKGGGSRSGKLWNNKQTPIPVRTPSGEAARAGTYMGNIKARRPEKGGGSRSGKLWNNRETPIPVRTPDGDAARAGNYTGNLKARRPQKGGGSISGKLWNNKETPIPVRTPPAEAEKAGKYPGNIRRFQVQPGFSDQGEEFSGNIKLKKFKKSYVQNPNAVDESTLKKRPHKTTYDVDGLQVKVKRRDYVDNPNTADESLKKLEPTKTTKAVAGLQVRVKRRDYVKNPNTHEDALLKLKPTAATRATAGLQVKVKQYNYVRNPSSADDALRVREPGKAFAKASDYQGNIKMQKFKLFDRNRELHPDSRFVKTNKNNVAEEKDMFTNFKLWWARLFKKNETQPDHLKEKQRKPRYDKREEGLWYD